MTSGCGEGCLILVLRLIIAAIVLYVLFGILCFIISYIPVLLVMFIGYLILIGISKLF